jgi:uncharacterized protein YnzC (UPF0291/DUF896 family)
MNMGGRVKNSPFILKDVDIIKKKGNSVTNKKIPSLISVTNLRIKIITYPFQE